MRMHDNRPDPDTLLARVREEEAQQTRGKLKIFFGATAGVGKTYAMLEAAHARRKEGVDVVVGWVDTHGRAETEALLAGLEVLPRRAVAYRGTTLGAFDLDAALARRPALSWWTNWPIPMLRARGTPNAGKISRSYLTPASMSTPQSMSNIWRA